MDVVDHDFLAADEAREVETQRGDVGLEFLFRLLERHEHAGFVELRRAAHEKFGCQQRLAAAGATADERRASAGQSAARDLVESLDARGTLGQQRGGDFASVGFHAGVSILC